MFLCYCPYLCADSTSARQERLLQGLMREIVRMTAQKQPLEVGVPLYPFSRTSLWRKDESEQGPLEDTAAGMPLPVSPPYDEPSPSQPTTGHARSASQTSGWSMREDMKGSPPGMDAVSPYAAS